MNVQVLVFNQQGQKLEDRFFKTLEEALAEAKALIEQGFAVHIQKAN